MSKRTTREEALDKFLGDNHEEGATIPHDYFWSLFGLKQPRAGSQYTVAMLNRANLEYAGDMEWLKNRLFEHGKDLQSVRKEGYALLRWTERVDVVVGDAKRDIAKSVRHNVKRLQSIPNVHLLNGDQQRRHDAAMLMLQHINAIRKNKNRFGEAEAE